MIDLSIIVPVYNVEKYLSRCIESILSQTVKDWELILVDDGSPDNSGSLCDTYSSKDTRIRVIHKENGGVSSARNRGIAEAKGKWVTFIDADDFISPTFIEGLIKPTMSHKDLDFVQAGCTNWANGLAIGINQKYDDYVGNDLPKLYDCFRGLTVSKLFSLENVKQWSDGLSLRFDENLKIAEDMLFTLNYLSTVKKYALSSEIGYYYRRDNDGSLTKTIKKDSYEKSLYSWRQIYNSLITVCELNNIAPLSLKHRRSVLGTSLAALINSIYQLHYSRSQRLKHLKNDFSDAEMEYLKYSKHSNTIAELSNKLLEKRHYVMYDLVQTLYHTIITFGSFVKHRITFIL